MVKEVKAYQCETCSEVYVSKGSAQMCELRHTHEDTLR
jgi:hypothetical protein